MARTTTLHGVTLEALGHGCYRVTTEPTVLVMHVGTGRRGEPGRRYTYQKYSYTGSDTTYYSLATACRAYAASRKTT